MKRLILKLKVSQCKRLYSVMFCYLRVSFAYIYFVFDHIAVITVITVIAVIAVIAVITVIAVIAVIAVITVIAVID